MDSKKSPKITMNQEAFNLVASKLLGMDLDAHLRTKLLFGQESPSAELFGIPVEIVEE
jgi:hypothetical protein